MTMSTVSPATETQESFAALFEESLLRQEMRSGEVITAEVVRVDNDEVVVNAGLKSESVISADEFRNDLGEIEVKPGDFVKVAIEMLEDGYGATKLSREKAKRIAAWNDLEAAMEQGALVSGVVNGKVKGGLTVMVNGIRAFPLADYKMTVTQPVTHVQATSTSVVRVPLRVVPAYTIAVEPAQIVEVLSQSRKP